MGSRGIRLEEELRNRGVRERKEGKMRKGERREMGGERDMKGGEEGRWEIGGGSSGKKNTKEKWG